MEYLLQQRFLMAHYEAGIGPPEVGREHDALVLESSEALHVVKTVAEDVRSVCLALGGEQRELTIKPRYRSNPNISTLREVVARRKIQ